jgi:hypothetical protein
MTSTIKVNTIKDTGDNNMVVKCGSTLTLGKSGDTVAIASGASTSGMGRTGTVDWQTSIKTSTITAANGEGYFVNTTGGAITANLPAGTAGSIVAFKDYLGTFDSNALTIAANGSQKINGDASIDLVVDTEGESITLVYADDTQGWLVVNDGNNDAGSQARYITATGGTITTVCTNFKVHTFTGPGTFTVCSVGNAAGSNTVDYLVIAGGGGGGYCMGGGGGAGGFRESSGTASGSYSASPLGACVSALPVSAQGYPIAIGAGAGGGTSNNDKGCSGAVSTFSTITSAGGGGGGARPNSPDSTLGIAGGSGGGNANDSPPSNTNPAGNTPPVSPPQGQPGGFGRGNTGVNKAGGGGGATAAGGDGGPGEVSGPGGAGATSSINATPTGRAGGGAGGIYSGGGHSKGTASDGGGVGGPGAQNGTANTGGGGGGAGHSSDPGTQNGGTGGSGIVIIRYKFQN